MTLEQLEKLSDREIDSLVYKAIHGKPFELSDECPHCGGTLIMPDPNGLFASCFQCNDVVVRLPDYSTDGNAMLEVVEKMHRDKFLIRVSNKNAATGYWWVYIDDTVVQCTSLPRGVCIAALLAVQKGADK